MNQICSVLDEMRVSSDLVLVNAIKGRHPDHSDIQISVSQPVYSLFDIRDCPEDNFCVKLVC